MPLHVIHEITASDEFDDEEQARWCLKAGVQTDKERMIRGLFEDVFFTLNPVDILVVVDDRFLDHFHGVETRRLMNVAQMPRPILGEKDLRVRTAADDFE